MTEKSQYYSHINAESLNLRWKLPICSKTIKPYIMQRKAQWQGSKINAKRLKTSAMALNYWFMGFFTKMPQASTTTINHHHKPSNSGPKWTIAVVCRICWPGTPETRHVLQHVVKLQGRDLFNVNKLTPKLLPRWKPTIEGQCKENTPTPRTQWSWPRQQYSPSRRRKPTKHLAKQPSYQMPSTRETTGIVASQICNQSRIDKIFSYT